MVAYIAMVMFGTSREAARSVFFCLMMMRYVIRTVFCDSDLLYGGAAWDQTPHRMGQGNGCAPVVLITISSPLFEILREAGYGLELLVPITAMTLYIARFGFVDDTDLIQGKTGETIDELVNRTQELLTLWEVTTSNRRSTQCERKKQLDSHSIRLEEWEKQIKNHQQENCAES